MNAYIQLEKIPEMVETTPLKSERTSHSNDYPGDHFAEKI